MIAIDQILRIPLLPVLVAQGLNVRRKALQLPEPEGPRQGEVGDGPPLRLLIAGDSAAAGVGADTQANALSGRLVARLARHHRVTWRLEATTGHRTKDTIARLSQVSQQFDVAVTSLGVNDVTRAMPLAHFLDRQRWLVELMMSQLGVRHVILSGVPQMELFPALPDPLSWVLGRHAARLDTALAQIAAEQVNVTHMPLQLPHDPTFAAQDGYHPSERAYAVWADHLAAEILNAAAY